MPFFSGLFRAPVPSRVLIQILLPITADGQNFDSAAALAETRRELAETFDGLTAYLRSPAVGLWTAPDGRQEKDDVVMVEVVADTFDRRWWGAYARTLARRFHQETIHVRAMAIDTTDG
jgi:hypothetical protein